MRYFCEKTGDLMKLKLFSVCGIASAFLLFSSNTHGQIIETVAGNGLQASQ
jgi:hypothetical protein